MSQVLNLVLSAEVPAWRAALRERCLRFFGSEELWRELESAYGAPHRAYHSLAHLAQMFAALDACPVATPYRGVIELATWFHDFCYETDSAAYPLNELNSVEAMLRLTGTLVPAPRRAEIADTPSLSLAREFILSTVGHLPTANCVGMGGCAVHACSLFLGADLSILGGTWAEVLAYDEGIAVEFGAGIANPDPLFAKGRLAALQSFKSRGRVFRTPDFLELEPAAQRNLDGLISRWSALAARPD
jgi:predicted metal-dependent HD superfamily phosphohydrolase